MKKKYFLLLAFLPLISIAQITFEKGYFVDNSNNRTECLIRNIEWNDTPSEFEYKLSENDAVQTKKDFEVAEFSFGNTKFISTNVDMDFSGDRTTNLTSTKNPEFKNVRIFMKLITDGKAKLYHYGKNDLQRYFYSVNDGEVQQLVYKRYYPDHYKLDIAKNNLFRQQLWTDVKCAETQMSDVEKLAYTNAELVKYFESVNKCNGSAVVAKTETKAKGSINLKGSVMFGRHKLGFDRPSLTSHTFENKSYVAFGAEFEWIVPFWNNKWGVIVEPSFGHSYESDESNGTFNYTADLKYFHIGAGFRHYFFLNDNSKIFLNATLNYDGIAGKSQMAFTESNHVYEPLEFGGNSITPAMGAGFNFKKFFLEFRYYPESNPSPYAGITYSYTKSELIFRYQFL